MKGLNTGELFEGYRIIKRLDEKNEPSSRTCSYLADTPDGQKACLTFLDNDKIVGGSNGADGERERARVNSQFIGNASLWKEIDHPNISKLYKLDRVSKNDMYYLVREYVSDLPLFEAAKGLTAVEMIPLFVPVLEALDYLHNKPLEASGISAKGVLHLNVKSKRIRVKMEESGPYTVKLTDCGYAVPIKEARQDGVRFGTPGYMSPEVVLKKNKLIGPRSDLYSFGALMYYCITSKLPFPGRLSAGSDLEKLAAIIGGEEHLPLPPSAINISCPPALNNIIVRLLQKNPSDRVYKNAIEVVNSLQIISPAKDSGGQMADDISIV